MMKTMTIVVMNRMISGLKRMVCIILMISFISYVNT